MTDNKKVAQETVSKALEALQDLAKGHKSGATNTTRVESMSGVGGSTQIYHTPSNSDPGSWAGSVGRDVPENGASDDVDANGTDLKGVSRGLMKSILEKVSKGQALTEAETFVLKSVVSKAGGFMDDKDDDKKDKAEKAVSPTPSAPPMAKGEKEDEDDDKKFGKSLGQTASEHEDVSKGLELSPFLSGWVEVQSEQLDSVVSRIEKAIKSNIARMDNENSEFQANLAKSITALAEVLTLQGQRIEQIESTPARGPKSVQNPQVVEKSFGPGGQPEGDQLTKSQILDSMVDLVKKGEMNPQEVIRFESTDRITRDVEEKVRAHRARR